jgi:hypothetical protein
MLKTITLLILVCETLVAQQSKITQSTLECASFEVSDLAAAVRTSLCTNSSALGNGALVKVEPAMFSSVYAPAHAVVEHVLCLVEILETSGETVFEGKTSINKFLVIFSRNKYSNFENWELASKLTEQTAVRMRFASIRLDNNGHYSSERLNAFVSEWGMKAKTGGSPVWEQWELITNWVFRSTWNNITGESK